MLLEWRQIRFPVNAQKRIRERRRRPRNRMERERKAPTSGAEVKERRKGLNQPLGDDALFRLLSSSMFSLRRRVARSERRKSQTSNERKPDARFQYILYYTYEILHFYSQIKKGQIWLSRRPNWYLCLLLNEEKASHKKRPFPPPPQVSEADPLFCQSRSIFHILLSVIQ